ncbi:SOS response-associated peptidase family protein [Streptomyces kronopolitis]|uniref:SOS response-associated peptidase family protein n=1 Tax=Streptomyces kronopolitis TaxID=1612435 RepID=UPI00342D5CCD
MINARAETAAEKLAYRRAFAKHRCLLPAYGFYEWQNLAATETTKARKQPYVISPEEGQITAPAGPVQVLARLRGRTRQRAGSVVVDFHSHHHRSRWPRPLRVPLVAPRATGASGSTLPTSTPTDCAPC